MSYVLGLYGNFNASLPELSPVAYDAEFSAVFDADLGPNWNSFRTNGRKVAKQAAVIPRPISTQDHIAIPTL